MPSRTADVVVYRETSISKVAFFTTLLIALVAIIALVIALDNLDTTAGQAYFWIIAGSASVAFFLGLCMTQLTVTVTQQRLILTFGIFRKVIPRQALEFAEPTQIQMSVYWGQGIRKGRDRSWGWITSAGKGLRVTVHREDEKKPLVLVFNSRHPLRLTNILDIPHIEEEEPEAAEEVVEDFVNEESGTEPIQPDAV
ncbi:hypothetical protein K8R78_02520, partial [bacterium]|nr:hypothetical protein [bacterium]